MSKGQENELFGPFLTEQQELQSIYCAILLKAFLLQ